ESEHGQHTSMVVRSAGEMELAEDSVYMGLDRLRAEHELLADAPIRTTFRHQGEDFTLSGRQVPERILTAPASEELRDHLGVDRGPAATDSAHGFEELLDLHHPVLEQIAKALRGLAEELQRMPRLDHLREYEQADLRIPLPDLLRCARS